MAATAATAATAAIDPAASSGATMKLENTEKRDALRAIEQKYQKQWADQKLYEVNAPTLQEFPKNTHPEDLRKKIPKYFGTMAFPYVNGVPHLGHGFTVSKIEFISRVARAQGKRTLYPQGYHCTGMPIKASADKIVREIELFGKDFENYKEEEEEDEPIETKQVREKTDLTKFTNTKKGKAALKSAKVKYQFQVMLSIGIPKEEIHKFADAHHWIEFFPDKWKEGLNGFGCSIDWRRAFVTTDANLYFDSFVQWQMRKLKAIGKIMYGKRYTVYSPKDGQPCLDHDRQSGEGVLVQEYTGIKCKVKSWSDPAKTSLGDKIPSSAHVYLVSATLRPETMYGQTNVFVSPKITYGIFKISDSDYYLITTRAARNMAHQGIFPKWGQFPKVADIAGADIVGTLIEAPLSARKDVYVVPMDTIKEAKGTGVVTSVPSDSPDDYAMTVELQKKAAFYKIKPEWVSIDILPIIETPTYGNLTAPTLVKTLKISSPKDVKQLTEAKELAYKEGFYSGKMIYGDFKGSSVQDAKPKVKKQLIESGDAFVYSEPDGPVTSRSGDDCVAALLDQWYWAYGSGDEVWRQQVIDHVLRKDGLEFNSFTQETENAIINTLGWMDQWAVTRNYGLGTRLPWDKSQLVESLSDSTIYMAYYTIARFLHADIYGKVEGPAKINVEQLTDEVWDYIFHLGKEPKSDIALDTLDEMRREFEYFYHLDMRSSGKDLINNHLMFFLYHHQAIWGQNETTMQFLPAGIRMNGHLMLNGEKMSKSTGNFLTMSDAVEKFGADATRIALADAGDGVEDSNFDETVANSVILKISELKNWIESMISNVLVLKEDETIASVREKEKLKSSDTIQRTGPLVFWDRVFENELNTLTREAVDHYENFNFKAALKSAFYDLTGVRDTYRVACISSGIGLHRDLVHRYVELQARLLAPIAPHWSEYIWQEVLQKSGSITLEIFPSVDEPIDSLASAALYVRNTTSAIGAAEGAQVKRQAKGKSIQFDPKKDKKLTIFVAQSWPQWQNKYIELVRVQLEKLGVIDSKEISKNIEKSDSKKAMPFIQSLKRKLDSGESREAVFERKLPFNEQEILKAMVPGLKTSVPKLQDVIIVQVDEDGKTGVDVNSGIKFDALSVISGSAEPGIPSFEFVNI